MSTQKIYSINCPHCNHTQEALIAISINAARSPHLRNALLDQTLHCFLCGCCQMSFTVDVDMNWIDFERKHWLRIFPLAERNNWEKLIHQSTDTYQRYLVDDSAPSVARSLGEGMRVRSVFGLGALREKIIAWDASLDDRILAICQWTLFLEQANTDQLGMPRLISCSDNTLRFVSEDGKWLWEKPLDFYHKLENECKHAAELQNLLSGPWVDPMRLFYQ